MSRCYTALVHEEAEGGFWAEVEELPGCFASGESLDELEADVRDAIEAYVLALEEMGEPIPEGRPTAADGDRRWELPVAL